jgi:hypothetical protein
VDPLEPRKGEIEVREKPPSKKATVTKGPAVEVVDAAMVERARERLRDVIMQALVSGRPKTVVVESVEFGNISAVLRPESELLVLRELIFNMGGPGQGSFIHGAFEQAAIDIARQLGARSVRVGMHPLLNKAWAKELMKLGYKFENLPWGGGIKLNVLIRTLPL